LLSGVPSRRRPATVSKAGHVSQQGKVTMMLVIALFVVLFAGVV
jgi:hypothetical protein